MTQEINPLESFENAPEEPFSYVVNSPFTKPSIKDMLNVTVVTEEDWKSVLAQTNRIPDRDDLVWVRDDNGDVVAAMINDPELIEIINQNNKLHKNQKG